MFVNKFCCEEATLSQQTTQMNSKLKAAIGILDVGIKKDSLATSHVFPSYDKEDLKR